HGESAENIQLILLQRVGSIDGSAESAAGAIVASLLLSLLLRGSGSNLSRRLVDGSGAFEAEAERLPGLHLLRHFHHRVALVGILHGLEARPSCGREV